MQAFRPRAHEVARRAGIEGEVLVQVCHAAALHDVGKVAIPDAIINKPAALDDAGWAFMRRSLNAGPACVAPEREDFNRWPHLAPPRP
jgi:response regulator RpfG family c-di-GMP phosphodiesterase